MAATRSSNGGSLASGNVGGGRGRKLRATTPRQLALMELNLGKFDELTQAVAMGGAEWMQEVVTAAAANAPDSPYDPYPLGEGLPKQGGVLAYIGNLKVFGWSIRGDQPAKPRALRLVTKEHSVVIAGGFGFPGRFAERGTIRQAPQPFFEPEFDRRAGSALSQIGERVKPLVARIR